MRDNFEQFDTCLMTDPANKTSTTTSSPVDLNVLNSVTILFVLGATSSDTLSGSLYWTCKLTECDTVGGTYTDVVDAEVIDGTTSPTNEKKIDANGKLSKVYKLGYTGNARFIRGVITASGTHSYGNVLGIIAIEGDLRVGPTNQASVAIAS